MSEEVKKEKSLIEIQLEELKLLPRLTEIFASTNINFLIWSWSSKPYLPTLNNIENDINEAIKSWNEENQVKWYKEYLEKVMIPNKNIIEQNFSEEIYKNEGNEDIKNKRWISRNQKVDYIDTMNDYINFLNTITKLIIDRKTTVLSKQVNIFTTNIDIFFEKVFEDLELNYNDGFIWRMNPIFDLSNFKKSVIQRSNHFDNRSEIPVFNLLKIHWSLTWKYKESELLNPNRKIYLSSDLSHFDNTLLSKIWTDFIQDYKKKLLVVNPEDSKFSETVLNKYYYELLRSYSSELERENSVLFVIGFSMADQHIQEITKRVARSNPTLQIYIFSFSKSSKKDMEGKMEVDKYLNISVIAPDYIEEIDKYNYDLETITNEIFKKINFNRKKDDTK